MYSLNFLFIIGDKCNVITDYFFWHKKKNSLRSRPIFKIYSKIVRVSFYLSSHVTLHIAHASFFSSWQKIWLSMILFVNQVLFFTSNSLMTPYELSCLHSFNPRHQWPPCNTLCIKLFNSDFFFLFCVI